MALDFGTVRIGVAISDELRMLASARGTIPNDQRALNAIASLAEREHVRYVVLGLPIGLTGNDTDMTRKVRDFGNKLEVKFATREIAIELFDERLTSVMANANVAMSGLSKSKRERKGIRDEEAARILLQEYLERIKRPG